MRNVLILVLLVPAIVLAVASMAMSSTVTSREVPRPDDHPDDWEYVHRLNPADDYRRCRQCHLPSKDCVACHSEAWSHEQGLQAIATHGAESVERSGRGCYVCHRSSHCDTCHGGVSLPHAEDYLDRHSDDRALQDACMTCHAESDCSPCHLRHGMHQHEGALR